MGFFCFRLFLIVFLVKEVFFLRFSIVKFFFLELLYKFGVVCSDCGLEKV